MAVKPPETCTFPKTSLDEGLLLGKNINKRFDTCGRLDATVIANCMACNISSKYLSPSLHSRVELPGVSHLASSPCDTSLLGKIKACRGLMAKQSAGLNFSDPSSGSSSGSGSHASIATRTAVRMNLEMAGEKVQSELLKRCQDPSYAFKDPDVEKTIGAYRFLDPVGNVPQVTCEGVEQILAVNRSSCEISERIERADAQNSEAFHAIVRACIAPIPSINQETQKVRNILIRENITNGDGRVVEGVCHAAIEMIAKNPERNY